MGDLTERKTPTFQNDVEYVPKMSVWALLCLFLLVVTKEYVLRISWGIYLEQYVFFVQMHSHVSAAPLFEG